MKKLFTLIISLLFIPIVHADVVFTDVTTGHPNHNAIQYLHEKGVINGYENNTFRPNQNVNRAEALKMILLGSEVFVPDIQEQSIFPDVSWESWYGKYVLKAKNLTIVKGDGQTGLFAPGDTINLAEILKILIETKQIETSSPSENPYWDVDKNAWFAPYFDYARRTGLLDQSQSEEVNPALAINRGMLAELMYRVMTMPNGYEKGQASYYGEKFHGKNHRQRRSI